MRGRLRGIVLKHAEKMKHLYENLELVIQEVSRERSVERILKESLEDAVQLCNKLVDRSLDRELFKGERSACGFICPIWKLSWGKVSS